jgi:hypothetical protein
MLKNKNFNPQDYYLSNKFENIDVFKKVKKRKKRKIENFQVDDIIKVKSTFKHLNKNKEELELMQGYQGIIKHYYNNKSNIKHTMGSYLVRIDDLDESDNTFYFSETELWGNFRVSKRIVKNKKKILCKYYHELGFCKLNDKCPYIHDNSSKKSKYKKIMCKNFAKGNCPYGINCLYSHGKEEIDI